MNEFLALERIAFVRVFFLFLGSCNEDTITLSAFEVKSIESSICAKGKYMSCYENTNRLGGSIEFETRMQEDLVGGNWMVGITN